MVLKVRVPISASCGILLEMQLLRLYHRPTESDTPGTVFISLPGYSNANLSLRITNLDPRYSNVILEPATWASPGSLLWCTISAPTLNLLSQNLHLKIPRRLMCTLKSEKHWSRLYFLASQIYFLLRWFIWLYFLSTTRLLAAWENE